MKTDVLIIGAGPAGLFSAYELVRNLSNVDKNLNITIVDRGRSIEKRFCTLKTEGKCSNCSICSIMYGVGGAGLFSSGIINLRPDIGGDLHELLGSWNLANELVNYVDEVLRKFGAPERIYNPSSDDLADFQRKFVKVGAQLIPIKQRHLGTEHSVKVISNIVNYLVNHGVNIITETEVYLILSLIHI